ncbi:LysR family transcriptional regulator [Candidatus Halocynthiibacter alkanivorans]|jgi:LysR family transcriptional regulator, regulator for bpeEF and oprC|uniref:LysR family transcriptional regulator n=1 Tax=Candidatus Halocynthiibacter alkanivorans TaxID=2267619 RepID=UPI00135A7907|nr:LysR family transcriptional regulator [Candidatus Halocynthiibacter alkanivorans]
MDADLLTDMAVFAAVVEGNSFSAAATDLQMSKSNVSRRVAALEDRLQLKLMHRTTRKLSLTESGRVYYEHCARLVDEARTADDAIRAMHSTPSGLLNVSLPETLGRAFILPLLPEFLKMYPEIKLNLTITSRKVDLSEERCDVAVRKGEIDDESLCAVALGSSTQYLFASPGYLASAQPLRQPDDLAAHSYLASKITFGPVDLMLEHGNDTTKVRVNPRLSVRDHEALLSLTVDGLGVALLPAWMTRKYVRSGKLVPVLPEYRGPSVDFNVVFQPHRGMAPNLKAFVDFLRKRFRTNRPWEFESPDNSILKVTS